MRFDELNEDNYIIFAIKNYENPQAITQDDFFEDMKRFKWIKELLISKGCKLVVLWDVQIDIKNLETITGVTNQNIIDGHLSYNSHKMLAMQFYKKYIKKDLI